MDVVVRVVGGDVVGRAANRDLAVAEEPELAVLGQRAGVVHPGKRLANGAVREDVVIGAGLRRGSGRQCGYCCRASFRTALPQHIHVCVGQVGVAVARVVRLDDAVVD